MERSEGNDGLSGTKSKGNLLDNNLTSKENTNDGIMTGGGPVNILKVNMSDSLHKKGGAPPRQGTQIQADTTHVQQTPDVNFVSEPNDQPAGDFDQGSSLLASQNPYFNADS